jgi:mycofactocin system glycosyltransferase
VTTYRLDGSVERFGDVIIGGSPLTLFRLTARGGEALDRIADGRDDSAADVAVSPLIDRLVDAGVVHPVPTGGRFGVDDVTVVMPVHDAAFMAPPGAIVVDDASQPPLYGATVRLAERAGPGGARNAGLERVTTSLVAFVDADVTLPDGWLEPLIAHFDDDRVGLVAPRVRSAPARGLVGRYEVAHSPLDLGDEPGRVRANTRVSYVPAATIVCRVDAVRDVGGFDRGLRHGEDVDLVWRLDEAGWRCRYEPASEVLHAPRPTWRSWAAQRVAYGSSAAALARRHPGALAPVRANGWSAVCWALAALGHRIAGAATGVVTAAALVPQLHDVPAGAAFRLAATGNARAGRLFADAVRRAWWPLVIVAAVRSRAARRIAVAAALAAGSPMRFADDVAYCAGVWRGMWRERTLAPITPRFSSWPARRRRAE